MEKWEKILRHELEELVPDGIYTIGEGDFIAQTGKDGYIDYRVALHKTLLSVPMRTTGTGDYKGKENYNPEMFTIENFNRIFKEVSEDSFDGSGVEKFHGDEIGQASFVPSKINSSALKKFLKNCRLDIEEHTYINKLNDSDKTDKL